MLVACGSKSQPQAAPATSAAKPAATKQAPPAVATPEAPTKPAPPAETLQEVAQLQARFAKDTCEPQALARLDALYQQYGVVPSLVEALKVAYTQCRATSELADLLAATTPDSAPEAQRLAVAAAYIRAARYPQAIDVLHTLTAEPSAKTSQAAWLLGYALFHTGDSHGALPWLTAARAHASNEDAATLIGLALMHTDQLDAAIAELEAGYRRAPQNLALSQALTRAYHRAGRYDDAATVAAAERTQRQAFQTQSATKARLSAMSTAFRAARASGDTDEALRLLDEMSKLAPASMRRQLLDARISLLRTLGRDDEARVFQQQANALPATP